MRLKVTQLSGRDRARPRPTWFQSPCSHTLGPTGHLSWMFLSTRLQPTSRQWISVFKSPMPSTALAHYQSVNTCINSCWMSVFWYHIYLPSHAILTSHSALAHPGGTNVPAESTALPPRRELPPVLSWATCPLSVSEFVCNASSEPTCFSRNFPERAFACRPLCSTNPTP